MKINFTFILYLLFKTSFLQCVEIPKSIDVFNAQLKCNDSYFKNSFWNQDSILLNRLSRDKVIVISQPKVEDNIKLKKQFKSDKVIFKLTYKTYAQLFCNEFKKPKLDYLELRKNESRSYFSISESEKKKNKFELIGYEFDDILNDKSTDDDEPEFFYNGLTQAETEGIYCIVLIEDFLKNKNLVNVERLCKGKSKEMKKMTIDAISNAQKNLIELRKNGKI